MVLKVGFIENCSNKFLLIVLLTMGDFMKKGIFEWAIIIWTILLVFLITGWIMIEFYNWKDTIVAAIIAFVGAIIGGSLTLIGVNKTIQHNNEKEEQQILMIQYKTLIKSIKSMDVVRNEITESQLSNVPFSACRQLITEMFDKTGGILDSSVENNEIVYEVIYKLYKYVCSINADYILPIHVKSSNDNDLYNSLYNKIIEVIEILENERVRLRVNINKSQLN